MPCDSFRWLTTALGLAMWLGFYGSPTRVTLPPAEVAIVSLQNEIAADTDSSDGDEADSGSVDSGSEDEGGGESGSEEESD